MALGRSFVRNTNEPRMRNHHGGATWDNVTVILLTGESVRGHVDTTWGAYIYFEVNKKWYKIPVTKWNGRGTLDLRV